MVRTYKKKTDRKATTPRKLTEALSLVKAGYSIRQAAKQKGVNRQTMWRVAQKAKKAADPESPENVALSFGTKTVFTSVYQRSRK